MDCFRINIADVGEFLIECESVGAVADIIEQCKLSAEKESMAKELSTLRANHFDLHTDGHQTEAEIEMLRSQVGVHL